MIEQLQPYQDWIWWAAMLSLLVFVGSLVGVPWIVVRIPADYFVSKRRPKTRFTDEHPVIRWAVRVLKNIVGVTLMLAGIAMLVLPGQGLLTLAVGTLLIDFPGKHRIERRLVGTRPVLNSINWLRRRAGVEPLQAEATPPAKPPPEGR